MIKGNGEFQLLYDRDKSIKRYNPQLAAYTDWHHQDTFRAGNRRQ